MKYIELTLLNGNKFAFDASAIMVMQPNDTGTHIIFNYALQIDGAVTNEADVQETTSEIIALINA